MTILDEIEEEVKCPSCGAEFVIKYDTQYVEDSPEWCPFCGAEIEDEEDEYKNISGENIFIPFVKRKDPNVVKKVSPTGKNTMDQAMNSKKKFKSTAKKTSEEKSFRSTLPRDV